MNLRTGQLERKEVRWEQVAREFAYYCQICGRRPKLQDVQRYLLGGCCGECEREAGTESDRHGVRPAV